MTHDDIETRIRRHISAFKAVRDAVDLAEKTVNTADRERIAELERDNNALREAFSERDEMYRASVAERDELRHNLAQNAAITETLRAELALLKDGIEMNNGWPAHSPGATATPVVEEEQGPWVIQTADPFQFEGGDRYRFSGLNEATKFQTMAMAEAHIEKMEPDLAEEWIPLRVITLAEAHRIAGAK